MSTRKANENRISVRKDMRIEKELLERVDAARGDVPFAAWVKRAILMRLDGTADTAQVQESEVKQAINKDGVINTTASDLPLNAKTNRDEIQAIAIDLKAKGNTYKQIAEHFNSLGYLTGTLKPFRPDSVTSLVRYTNNLKESDIKL